MQVIDTTLGVDLNDPNSIASYWSDRLIETLYFAPKKVSTDIRDAALESPAFAQSLAKARQRSLGSKRTTMSSRRAYE